MRSMKVDSATMLSDLHLHNLILEGSTTFPNGLVIFNG
jgi:hypothetical protein